MVEETPDDSTLPTSNNNESETINLDIIQETEDLGTDIEVMNFNFCNGSRCSMSKSKNIY